ncbi:SRPBCC domain-containing protein [Rhizorhabdus sp.]|uniref:SRPBCC domain-containing protein n=1 Tax=Rhizorhabdus sp. TaxID=1968843 RepID=UPI0035AF3EE9
MSTEIHSASRIIIATPRAIFRAHIDPEVLFKWRPPKGMQARLHEFSARPGGGYRMELTYADGGGKGKSTANSDIVRVRFAELIPDDKIVEEAVFESDEPANAGTMTITTTLAPVTGGTKVTVTAENVPAGISEKDHRKGMESSLRNLALLLE